MTPEHPSMPSYGQQPPIPSPLTSPPPGYGGGPQQPPTGPPYQLQWQPPRKSHRIRNVILSVVGAIVVITVIAVAANNGNANTPSTSSTYNPPASATPASAATSAPAVTSAPPPPAAAPQYTVSQQQAIDAAENYLSAEPGWSFQGLIDQLDSSAGDGFSVADATFAVNHLSPAPDWNQQAAIAAKNYMTTEPGWSCSGLVQQLDSPDGSQFTQAQAEYGAQSVGLGSC